MLVDSNVALRFLQLGHVQHKSASEAILILSERGVELYLATQNLVEVWAVATRPLKDNGLSYSIEEAAEALQRLKAVFTVLADSEHIFRLWEQLVIDHRVSGKATHDARLLAAMRVHGLTSILTFNTADFVRYPGIEVINPIDLVPAVAR